VYRPELLVVAYRFVHDPATSAWLYTISLSGPRLRSSGTTIHRSAAGETWHVQDGKAGPGAGAHGPVPSWAARFAATNRPAFPSHRSETTP
jgi:hypothetical protein